MHNAIFQPHDETVLLDLGGGTCRRILAYSDELMAVEVLFKTGAEGATHTHAHVQCSYVLSGKFRYTVDGESVIMQSGDSIVVPSKAPHGTLCLEEGTLLDIFTPKREDFLK